MPRIEHETIWSSVKKTRHAWTELCHLAGGMCIRGDLLKQRLGEEAYYYFFSGVWRGFFVCCEAGTEGRGLDAWRSETCLLSWEAARRTPRRGV